MRVRRLAALAAVLMAEVAAAQAQPLPERMYLNPGVLIGSSRMIALGGAFTGVAESASGTSANLAAIAARTPTENGPYQLSPLLTWQLNFGDYDFDNDGTADRANVSGQYLAGLQLRVGHLGLGAFLRTNHLSFCTAESCGFATDPNRIDLFFQDFTLAVGYAFLDENVVASVGLVGNFDTVENDLELWGYRGFGPELGVLVRPRGLPFRVGASARPGIDAAYLPGEAGTPVTVVGRQLYSGVVSPGVYSVGLSFKVGEGAFAYNDLPSLQAAPPSRGLDPRSPFHDMVRSRDDPHSGRVLVTAQLDVISPVSRAVPIGTFIRTQEPEAIGSRLGYTPRLGIEDLTFPGRLKTRLGAYYEYSPYPGNEGRLHLTGGAELFFIRLIDDWALTLTFDLAHQYTNAGLSIGAWR